MNEKQFIWWLLGFINSVELHGHPTQQEWEKIKETVIYVTCKAIEMGID